MDLGSRFKHLRLITDISLRNLLRQKRRNILLGIAIAFGMMILVLANSFSRGITDNLFNRMIVYAFGHMEVAFVEKNKFNTNITRDKARIEAIIKANVKDMRFIQESITAFTRAVGNGKAQMAILVGIDFTKQEDPGKTKWEIVQGNFADFTNGRFEYPLIVHEEKLKELNIKVGDIVRVKLSTIYGQEQSARLTLVAVAKSVGMFQSMATYVPFDKLKALLGYKPFESGSMQIILKDPKTAKEQADRLYQALKPNLAVINSVIKSPQGTSQASLFALYRKPEVLSLFTNLFPITAGRFYSITNKESILLTAGLAAKLKVGPGDRVAGIYRNKYEGRSTTNFYYIRALFDPKKIVSENTVFLNENDLYKTYYVNLPEDVPLDGKVFVPQTNNPLMPALAREWYLFPRSATGDDMNKKYSAMGRTRWKGTTLDVRTMYETASSVVQLEMVLNIITFAAVMFLFFIILIGVVNTMRMSIRERTREIGTIRAIGMQKKDVRNVFMMETFFLSFFASLSGTVAGFLVMGLLSLFHFNTSSALSILLVDRHLYFMPTPGMIAFDIIIILILSAVTAYFPSKRAANMLAAQALRHYE